MSGAPTHLVIGASGFVGRRLLEILGSGRALGTYARAPFPGGVHFDGETMRIADALPVGHGIRCAFVLHGYTDMSGCARDPGRAQRINVDGMQRLLTDLVDAGIRPLFASTDAVFDGERGGYTEESEPNPIITYGRHKRAVEEFVLDSGLPVLLARFSKVVSDAAGTHSLFGEWLAAIRAGAAIRCARDQAFSPIFIDDMAAALCALMESEETGLWHVGGPVRFSRLELFELFRNAILPFRPGLPAAEACSIRDFPFPEPRPLDTSLNVSKLTSAFRLKFASMEKLSHYYAKVHFA